MLRRPRKESGGCRVTTLLAFEQMYSAAPSASQRSVKGDQRAPGSCAKTGKVTVRPEVRTDLARARRSSPVVRETVRFADHHDARIAQNPIPCSPGLRSRKWRTIHDALVRQQPQQPHFSDSANCQFVQAGFFDPMLRHPMMRMDIDRKGDPDLAIRQVSQCRQASKS